MSKMHAPKKGLRNAFIASIRALMTSRFLSLSCFSKKKSVEKKNCWILSVRGLVPGSSPLYANFEFPLPVNFEHFPFPVIEYVLSFSLSLSLSACNRIRGGNLQLSYKTLDDEEEILDAIPAGRAQGYRAPLTCALLGGHFFSVIFFLAGVSLKKNFKKISC